jgi:signal transduction histidine kinase/CheY-like chemotaxis protein
LRHRDGSYRWISATGAIDFDENRNPIRMMGSHVDITVSKTLEEEREILERQLNQAQKIETVGRLAGGIAHDFNNMLGIILGYTEVVLEDDSLESETRDSLFEIQKAALRSSDLTRQLLAFARKQTVSPKVIEPNESVNAMMNMIQRLIGEDIQLMWNPGKDLWPVKIDPSQMDQILINLCVNSRDSIAGVGNIVIETANRIFDPEFCAHHPDFKDGEYVEILIGDSGTGMDEDTLSHIFEPFFTTKKSGLGTGLGLSMVYGIIKQNNGFINVSSEPDHGTTFKIYLPRFTGEITPIAEKEDSKPVPDGHETILLVEDQPEILNMTTKLLNRQGYTVLPATNATEAIRLANIYEKEIHLLMTDVIMPEMNGRDLAKEITTKHPGFKCLFMSGYTADIISHHGILDEGIYFIQKPFSSKDLSFKVREALNGN